MSECPLAEWKLNSTPKRSEKRLIIVSNLHKLKKLTEKCLTKREVCGRIYKSPDEGGTEGLRNRVAVGKVTNLEN